MAKFSRRRKKDEGADTSGSNWLTTYGDMMTLLLTFFVLLFSFATIDDVQFEIIMHHLREALGLLDAGTTLEQEVEPEILPGGMHDDLSQRMQDMALDDMEEEEEQEQEELEEMAEEIQTYIEDEGLEGEVVVDLEERGLMIRMFDSVLFDLGSAELRSEAEEILARVGSMLEDMDNQVRAEGHTDDLPIDTYRYPSNWELSVARATSVVRFLVEDHGLSPGNFSAAGYGEYRPIAETQPGGQPLNRRVDLVVLREEETEVEPEIPEEAVEASPDLPDEELEEVVN